MEEKFNGAAAELLIWVDENDWEIGYGEKMETHRLGQMHRAFSVFVYDPEYRQILLQKRAESKYHSGGLWSNSCCSHPRKDETFCSAVSRCLREELSIETEFHRLETKKPVDWTLSNSRSRLFRAGCFQYYADFGNLAEHELDHVLIFCRSRLEGPILFNQNEAADVRWISLDKLDAWLGADHAAFSSWFPQAYWLFRGFAG